MTKQRRKPNNPLRRAHTNNKQVLKSLAVAYVANAEHANKYVSLIDLNGNERPVTKIMNDAISMYPYKWFVYLIIGCYDGKGNREIKIDYVPCAKPYLQSELPEYLNERHQKFIGDVKSKSVDISFVGWVARASGRELERDELFNIFEKLKAWV